MRELKTQVAMKNVEGVAAVAVAATTKRESDALKIRNAKLNSEMMCVHSEFGDVKQLRAEIARSCNDVGKMTATLTNTTNMRDEGVERAENFRAQITASVRHENV